MEEPVENQQSNPKKRATWKTSIAILGIAIVVMAIAIGALFVFRGEDMQTEEQQQDGQTIEDTEEIVEDDSSKSVDLEVSTIIPDTTFTLNNKGRIIGFLNYWGAYDSKNKVRIVFMTEESLVDNPDENLPEEDAIQSFPSVTEDSQDYFVLLDEDIINSEDAEYQALVEFLRLIYSVHVRPAGQGFTMDVFMESALEELNDNSYFVIEQN